MSALKEQENLAIFWADRCKAILRDKEVMDDHDRADLETFCAIAVELIKSASPYKLREAARNVEIRHRIKNEKVNS